MSDKGLEQDPLKVEPQVADDQVVKNRVKRQDIAEQADDSEVYGLEEDIAQPRQGGVALIDYDTLMLGTPEVTRFAKHALNDEQKKKMRLAYLKLLKYQKFWHTSTQSLRPLFKAKNFAYIYKLNEVISSAYDRYETYPYIGGVYKRAVKLVIKDGSLCVQISHDKDVYGICIDVDENCKYAKVVPISSQYTGFLICNNNTKIEIGDILDFNSDGEVAKAVGPNLPAFIDIRALSGSFKIDFRTALERKDKDYKPDGDFIVSLVKVLCLGNRAETKKN